MSTRTTQLSDLGAYVETYRTSELMTVSLFILLIAFVFLIWLFVGLATNNMLIAWLVVIPLASGLGWMIWNGTGQQLALYEEGICFITRRHKRYIRWEEIMAVQTRSTDQDPTDEFITVHRIILHVQDGKPIVFGRIGKRTVELLEALQEGTDKFILPRYRLAVSANQPVTFGEKLTLSPDGIQQGQKFVPKSEIASVKHDPLNKYGFVVLRQNGKTVMHIQTRDLPNGHLFPRVLTLWVIQGVVGNG